MGEKECHKPIQKSAKTDLKEFNGIPVSKSSLKNNFLIHQVMKADNQSMK